MKKIIKENYPIMILIGLYLIISALGLITLGYRYTINSDDLSYLESGIIFYKTGKITMHGVLSAQIMPGLTFLIAYFCIWFKTIGSLVLALKIAWLIMGGISVYVLYKIMRMYTNKYISVIPCLFLFAPDFIWTNNLILTETPFMMICLLLIYYSLKFLREYKNKDYYFIILWYIIGIFIRPTIGLFPLGFIVCLIIKKYSWKEIIKKTLFAGIVITLVLTPWIIRNYNIFNRFIPLTYGMGNPQLLGTYQGYGYPSDEELDYNEVYNNLTDEFKYYLNAATPRDHMKVYYQLKYDGEIAKYRMHKWWKKDKRSMIWSYLISKPKIMLYSSFYWDKIFELSDNVNLVFRKIDLLLFLVGVILIIFKKSYLLECGLLMFVYSYHIILYSYSFAYGRYALTLFFFRFIIIGIGIDVIYKEIKNRRFKNESINNSASI